MELDVVLHCNRAGKPDACRHHYFTASLQAQVVDCLCKSIRVKSDSVSDSSKVNDIYFALWNLRTLDLFHLKRQVFIEICELVCFIRAA